MNKTQHWRAIVEGGRLYIAHPPNHHWRYDSPRNQRLVYKFALAKRLAYTSSQYLNENGLEMSAEEFLAVAERKVHEYE
jgi:hypothetical protein